MAAKPCTPQCDDDSFDCQSKLDKITTRCELMQQQWPLLLASFDQTCTAFTVQHSNHVLQPELPTPSCNNVHSFTNDKLEIPAPTATLDSIDKNWAITTDAQYYDSVQALDPSPPQHTHAMLETVLQQSMSILDVAKQQSQALQNLKAKSEVLLVLMTHVISARSISDFAIKFLRAWDCCLATSRMLMDCWRTVSNVAWVCWGGEGSSA